MQVLLFSILFTVYAKEEMEEPLQPLENSTNQGAGVKDLPSE